jgi:hypothetical protein
MVAPGDSRPAKPVIPFHKPKSVVPASAKRKAKAKPKVHRWSESAAEATLLTKYANATQPECIGMDSPVQHSGKTVYRRLDCLVDFTDGSYLAGTFKVTSSNSYRFTVTTERRFRSDPDAEPVPVDPEPVPIPADPAPSAPVNPDDYSDL